MAAVLAAAVSKAVQEGERMIKRGDVYWADLQPTVGSEQGGVRPVMILQNDKGNYFSSTVIIAPMTAKTGKHNLPIHVTVYAGEAGIGRTSMVLLEQIRVLDKSRLGEYIGHLEAGRMKDVEYAMAVSLGLFDDSGIEEEFGREQVEYEPSPESPYFDAFYDSVYTENHITYHVYTITDDFFKDGRPVEELGDGIIIG